MINAEEARTITEARIEEHRKQSQEMTDNLIKLTVDSGHFSVSVRTDETITYDILESLAIRYRKLGYICQLLSGTNYISSEQQGCLKISW